MKKIIYNIDALTENEMKRTIIRARAIIKNNKDEILMCYSNGLKHYEFPGGHLEKGETIEECLKREIKEETGLNVEVADKTPFMNIVHYCKNYLDTGVNTIVKFYYYSIDYNKKYDLSMSDFDKEEKKENYECRYIKLEDLEKVIRDNKKTTLENNAALNDILLVIKEYKKIKSES